MMLSKRVLLAMMPFAAEVAGCGGGLTPEGIAAEYRVFLPRDDQSPLGFASLHEAEGELPEPPSRPVVSIDYAALPLHAAGNEGGGFSYAGPIRRNPPGEDYTFTLDFPAEKGVTSKIAMVAPAAITLPTEATVISFEDDLTVAWASAEPGTKDAVHLALPGLDWEIGSHGVAHAAEGETTATIPASKLKEVWDSVPEPKTRVRADLVLRRRRTVALGPPFSSGDLTLDADVASVFLLLMP